MTIDGVHRIRVIGHRAMIIVMRWRWRRMIVRGSWMGVLLVRICHGCLCNVR